MKEKNPAAVALGRLSRASQTPEQRTRTASIAGSARWAKATPEQRKAHGAKMLAGKLAKKDAGN